MYPNEPLAQQIARDKAAEMRFFMQPPAAAPRHRHGAWLMGLLVVAMAGAGYVLR